MKIEKKSIEWVDDRGIKHAGEVRSLKNGYNIIKCVMCGFSHAVPIPSDAELNQYYSSTYYQSTKPDYARQCTDDQSWWELVYTERYEHFERLLGKKGRILDIGCGPGFFLAHGQKIGWEVEGIEPSEYASEYARGMGVSCTTASFDSGLVSHLGMFDVVLIDQAIEHISYPDQLLNLCRSILLPGGLICIVAANDFNPFQKAACTLLDLPEWWMNKKIKMKKQI